MIKKLIKKITQASEDKNWLLISEIDKELKLTIERSLARLSQKPQKAEKLMAELQQAEAAYNHLLTLCDQERQNLQRQTNQLKKSQVISQHYLAFSK